MKKWEIEDKLNIKLVEDTLTCEKNEVKLKMSKVALSSTDISYFAKNDSKIKVPGHSAIAYVSEEDEENGLKLGSRVVISPFIKNERFGNQEIDVLGVDTNGLLADFVKVPIENAIYFA